MGEGTHEDLLARLVDKVASLEESNGRLAARVRTLEGCGDHTRGAVEHDDEPVSRRGLLKKVGGAMAAGVAGAAVGNALGATPAGAASGDFMVVGTINTAETTTFVTNGNSSCRIANAGSGLHAEHIDPNCEAVYGRVWGASGIGVLGETSGHYTQTGVRGDSRAIGDGQGLGVHGITKAGIGVRAESTTFSGAGLQVLGRAFFSRSGRETFAAGQAAKTIAVGRLDTYSIVLATIQGNPAGTWVKSVSPDTAGARFTIRLNKAAPASLTVGWFVVN